jgi:hypothetical protein
MKLMLDPAQAPYFTHYSLRLPLDLIVATSLSTEDLRREYHLHNSFHSSYTSVQYCVGPSHNSGTPPQAHSHVAV